MDKIFEIINSEQKRQDNTVELIASENFVSDRVKQAVGSCMMLKYTEGYPSKESIAKFQEKYPDYVHTGNIGRYYGGCENFDELELYCRYMWQKVFKTDYHVNVQPHSGSSANMEVYASMLEPGDTVLSMSLNNGAHLTHGSPVNFSGKLYNMVFYGVNQYGRIDLDDIYNKVIAYKPKMVVIGASAYARAIPYHTIRTIIDLAAMKAGIDAPYMFVDMAHIAGLIVSGDHESPFGVADFITTTTQKTLRGNRGGIIFCKPEYAKKVDSAVFPGNQGGSLMNEIAGKAVTAEEALTPEFKEYGHQIIENAKAMADEFIKLGFKLVTDGTDNHLILLNLTDIGVSGKQVQDELDKHGITLNKNMVPNDTRSPTQTSGVRIGVPAMTTKGWKEKDFVECADKIAEIIKGMKTE